MRAPLLEDLVRTKGMCEEEVIEEMEKRGKILKITEEEAAEIAIGLIYMSEPEVGEAAKRLFDGDDVKGLYNRVNIIMRVLALFPNIIPNRFFPTKEWESLSAIKLEKIEEVLQLEGEKKLRDIEEADKAIEKADKQIKENPNEGFAWCSKGNALDKLKRHEEAIECYNKAIAINPNEGRFWDLKRWTLSVLGRDEEAIECYDKAIAINPNDENARDFKGYALRALGRHDDAKSVLRKQKV